MNNNKYNNEATFGEFYEQYETQANDNSKSLKFGLFPGISISDPKEAYINESMSAYTNFSTKVIVYMVIQFIIVAILFYLSSRLSRIEEKKQRLSKDDKILFDEEQNIL